MSGLAGGGDEDEDEELGRGEVDFLEVEKFFSYKFIKDFGCSFGRSVRWVSGFKVDNRVVRSVYDGYRVGKE